MKNRVYLKELMLYTKKALDKECPSGGGGQWGMKDIAE